MFTREAIGLGSAVLLAMTLTACMNQPRNQQQLASPGGVFNWTGYVVNPGEKVTLKVKDQSDGSWDTRWDATSESGGNSDGFLTWFAFGATNTAIRYGTPSSHRKYWRMIGNQGSQRRMAADVKTISPTRGDLFSFDVGADACINSQSSGQAIVNNCRSAASPVATVIANCGKANQACCLVNDTRNSCDRGRICDSSLKCTIPSGGFHQPCNSDNSCTSTSPDGFPAQCAEGTCRDMISRAPVLRSKLIVHTCDKPDAGTTDEIWVSLRDQVFFLDHPGGDARRNQTDTWGLAVPGIGSVSDITQLVIGTENGGDNWCIDRVELVVNGATVFTKSYGSAGMWILRINDPVYPSPSELMVADTTTIRNAIDAANRAQVCALPSSFSYADLESMIAGAMGDVFSKSRAEWGDGDSKFDASWGSYKPIITRVNASTIKVALKFRATAEIDGAPDFDITGDIEIRAAATCSMVRDGTGSSGGPSTFTNCAPDFRTSVTITKAVGIPDTILPGVNTIVGWIASEKVANAAQQAVAQFPDFDGYFNEAEAMVCERDTTNQICDPNDNVCTCPSISAGTSSVSFDWMSVSSVPFLLCLF